MEVIGYALLFLVAERCIPYCVWGFSAYSSRYTEREFIARYGLASFPRTPLGVAMVLSAAVDFLLPGLPVITGAVLVLTFVAWMLCLCFDVFRAMYR
jgi:hypothetical protein